MKNVLYGDRILYYERFVIDKYNIYNIIYVFMH